MGNLFCKPCVNLEYENEYENEYDKEEVNYVEYEKKPCAGSSFSLSPLNWENVSENTRSSSNNNYISSVPNHRRTEKVTS